MFFHNLLFFVYISGYILGYFHANSTKMEKQIWLIIFEAQIQFIDQFQCKVDT
jgi:hypothetical protein